MELESQQELEAMASNSSTSTGTGGEDESSPPAAAATSAIVKGKRTKRPRAPAPATSSTSSADGLSGTTEEEEDMAHCLILLAQGANRSLPSAAANPMPPSADKFVSRRFAEAATSAGGAKAGFYVYECKTCSKCFPSFQALGGHRASHKKPKLIHPAAPPPLPLPLPPATSPPPAPLLDDASLEITMNSFSSTTTAKQAAANKTTTSRVHECSICGSEFSSGQALGGHMRRHRPAVVPDSPDVKKEQRNVLSLDLNLPAPSSDEDRAADLATAAFSFGGARPMVFSATAAALVDCHY